jgi:hypothetical protein
MTEKQRTWTVEEVRKMLRVCDKTVRKLVKLGRLQKVPDCRAVRITDASLRALVGPSNG